MTLKKAIVLLSGGLDSTTCLALALSQGYDCHALSFAYGQRHLVELQAAKKIAAHFKVKHTIIELPQIQFEGSALTDLTQTIPAYTGAKSIPSTYVPARNTLFLSYALALAEVNNAKDIFIGVSAIDYSGYPDCRPEYIQAFQVLANLATKMGVEEGKLKIQTPLIQLSKAETIQLGLSLGLDYRMTVSCYQASPLGEACGSCDSCVLRKKGFLKAGVEDVTVYCLKSR